MNNGFVKYYDKYKISPVSQDITDLNRHILRRENLYQMIGISSLAFRGARVLEVGAGSGYNTLVFLLLGARVDIVEPNPTGRDEMIKLFKRYNIDSKQYKIYPCVIEEFSEEESYDFVIAEGFLPIFNVGQRAKILQKLLNHTDNKGYCVITTICEFSYFFEYLRIILGLVLVRNVVDYSVCVDILSEAFVSHVDALKFASRPIDDWVKDSLLNPTNDFFSFTMADGICQMNELSQRGGMNGCIVAGITPTIVPNLS